MRSITDEQGRTWIASAREEVTPRHHGRWYMVFHLDEPGAPDLPVPEIRWQTVESAERTIQSMSEFEVRRRLHAASARAALRATPS